MSVMIATFEALFVFLLLLPGFVTQRIIELLTPRKVRDTLGRLVSGAVLSIAIYCMYIIAFALPLDLPPIPVNYVKGIELWQINYPAAGIILFISIVSGLLIGKALDTGRLFYVLRADYISVPDPGDTTRRAIFCRAIRRLLRFTTGTGRDSVWEDTLRIQRTPFIQVTLGNGRRIVGKCVYYSDNPRTRELLIVPPDQSLLPNQEVPTVIVASAGSEKFLPVPGPGILITSAAKIETVDFLGQEKVEW